MVSSSISDFVACMVHKHWIFSVAVFFVFNVAEVLSKLELVIQMVKVMTRPDGRVLELFFITNGLYVSASLFFILRCTCKYVITY